MTLVLLGPLPHIHQLAHCLIDYDNLTKRENATLPSPAADLSSQQERLDWEIENKYYNAKINLLLKAITSDLPTELIDYEGLIVVIPENPQFDLKQVGHILGRAEGSNELRLLVRFEQESDLDEADSEAFTLFALDHGFEYIEINPSALVKDHESREKVGLPRVMEAIESHMWTTMQRKPKGPVAGHHKAENEEVSKRASTSSDFLPTPPATVCSSTDPRAFSLDPTLELPAIPQEDEEDLGLEDLVHTMMQARNLREQVEKGQMSDAQRREQAAQFALKLMEMLELEESSEEES